MTTLTIIQTIFYLLASITMVAIGILVGIVLYYLVCILRNTRNISDDLSHTYHKTKKHIKNIINSLTNNKKNENKK
jgi:hypothetical protein